MKDLHSEEVCFASPREDVNAPDLYLPLMAFLTFVVLVCFSMGALSDKFHPEVLGSTAFSALLCVFVESLLLYLGFYLISGEYVPPFLDLLSYSGYIFVSVVVNLSIGVFSSSFVYHVVTILTSFMSGIFFVRSVRDIVLSGSGVGDKRSQIFLVVIIISQIVVAWFLGSLADWKGVPVVVQVVQNAQTVMETTSM